MKRVDEKDCLWNGRCWYATVATTNHGETCEAVVAAKTIAPYAMKKLLAKAWCARQIMWLTR